MRSCLYFGHVAHSRVAPVAHRFRYPVTMALLDLEELPALVDSLWLLGHSKLAPVCFRAEDHLQCPGNQLPTKIRELVEQETGYVPTGPIRLLTQLRNYGYYFSPLNLYYIYEAAGSELEFVVAEVSNIPWLERQYYVLRASEYDRQDDKLSAQHAKTFHVSPFMDMNLEYDWRLNKPDSELYVQIGVSEDRRSFFQARLDLSRHALTDRALLFTLARYPFMNAQIVAVIYWQAFRLWCKKCPYYPHPKSLSSDSAQLEQNREQRTA